MSKEAMKLAVEMLQNKMYAHAEMYLTEALAKQEQGEPVAAIKTYADGIQDAIELLEDCNGNSIGWLIDRLGDYKYALTTTPQQRKPLTDEQLKNHYQNNEWLDGVRFAEQFHGIKENT